MRINGRAAAATAAAAVYILAVKLVSKEQKRETSTQFIQDDAYREMARTAAAAEVAQGKKHPSQNSVSSHITFWIYLISLAALVLAAALLIHFGLSVAAGICWILGMAISAFILRGPTRRFNGLYTIALIVIFEIQLAIAVLSTAIGMNTSGSVVSTLELTVYGVFVLGIFVCLGATWLPGWKFTEAVAVGLTGISIGLLCFPGLRFATGDVSPLYFTGSGLLFATGRSNQGLILSAGLIGDQNFPGGGIDTPASELFQITNPSKQPVHWAMLLTGAARIHITSRSHFGMRHINLIASGIGLNVDSSAVPAEMFFGILKSGASTSITGNTIGTFFDSNSDKSAVSLPTYGQGFPSDLSSTTRAIVTKVLGMKPQFRNSSKFTAQITSSPVSPFDSVVAASLSPSQSPELPSSLQWRIHDTQPIQYEIQDQSAADATSNALFIFAVLLGVAGAGIVAALQSVVRAFMVGSSKETSRE